MHHIHHELRIATTPSKIFQAISTQQGMQSWWPKIAGSNYELSSEVRLFFSEEYDWTAEVIAVEENRFIYFAMIKADADWTETTLKFDIAEQDDFCLLSFSHQNWKELNHHFKRTNYCWAFYLKMIKDYTEHNIVVPFEKRSIY